MPGTLDVVTAHSRQDRGSLASPISGTLFEGHAARVHLPGDPLYYPATPGSPESREYRDSDELTRMADQLDAGVPVTLLHPPDGEDVSDGHARVVGTVVRGKMDGRHALVKFIVHDAEGLAAARDGMHELSVGYSARTDENGYQRGTQVDHLAMVPRARCGPTCQFRADGAEVPLDAPACACKNDAMKTDGDLTSHARGELAAEDFADPAQRKLPIADEAHVRAAMSRFSETQFSSPSVRAEAKSRILARAHHFGIDPSGFQHADAHPHGTPCSGATCACGGACNTRANTMTAVTASQKEPAMELQLKLDAAIGDAAVQKARADAAEAALAAAKAHADALDSDLRLAKTQSDLAATHAATALAAAQADAVAKHDAALAESKSKHDAAIAESAAAQTDVLRKHVAVITHANAILGTVGADGKVVDHVATPVRDLKVAIIKHVDGYDVAATESEGFVEGMFVGAVSRHDASRGSAAATRVAINAMRNDAAPLPATGKSAEAAESAALVERLRTAHNTAGKQE